MKTKYIDERIKKKSAINGKMGGVNPGGGGNKNKISNETEK